MIIPDINLLLYAHDFNSPFHAKAVDWWQSCLGGTEPIGLPHVVTFGFIRIATNPRVFVSPMTTAEAAAAVDITMKKWSRSHLRCLAGTKSLARCITVAAR